MGVLSTFSKFGLILEPRPLNFMLFTEEKYFNRISHLISMHVNFYQKKYQDFKIFTHGKYLTTRLVTKQTPSYSIWVESDINICLFLLMTLPFNCFDYCTSNLLVDSCGPEANMIFQSIQSNRIFRIILTSVDILF